MEATHHRLPHHDEDEAVAVINGTSAAGRMKDRGVVNELVPLVGRINGRISDEWICMYVCI